MVLQSLSSNFSWPGISSNNSSKFYFYTFKSGLIRQRWVRVKWSWAASGSIPLAFLKYAKINFTYPSKTLSSFQRSLRYETKRLRTLFKILHSPLYKPFLKARNILSPRKMISSTSEGMEFFGRSFHIEISSPGERDWEKSGGRGIWSCPKNSLDQFRDTHSNWKWTHAKNLELPSENICQNLTSKKFWIFHGKSNSPANLFLLKSDHTRVIPRLYEDFSFTRKIERNPVPKGKVTKKSLNFKNFQIVWWDRAESHSIKFQFRFLTSLLALFWRKPSQKIFSLWTLSSHSRVVNIQNSQKFYRSHISS